MRSPTDHARALGGEPPRGGRADAAGAAGDQRRPSLESHGLKPILRRRHARPRLDHRRHRRLGYGLALRWARAGVPVVIGSRDAGRAAEAAERVRAAGRRAPTSQGLENAAAAAAAPVVVMSVPFRQPAETLQDDRREPQAAGTLVIDATVPLAPAVGGKPTRMLGVWQGSAAQQAAEMVPDGVRVVSALHTVSAPSLADLEPRARRGRARLRRPPRPQEARRSR